MFSHASYQFPNQLALTDISFSSNDAKMILKDGD